MLSKKYKERVGNFIRDVSPGTFGRLFYSTNLLLKYLTLTQADSLIEDFGWIRTLSLCQPNSSESKKPLTNISI